MESENQANRIWEKMIGAEVRSLYYGDLATRCNKVKQIITGVTFFLSSGAAATLAAKAPNWIPLVLAVFGAILMAYSIAVNLDKRASALSKLHYQWNHLSADYENLWNHWYEDDAEEVLERLLRRAREASEAGTELPYNEKLIEKWGERVYSKFGHNAA